MDTLSTNILTDFRNSLMNNEESKRPDDTPQGPPSETPGQGTPPDPPRDPGPKNPPKTRPDRPVA